MIAQTGREYLRFPFQTPECARMGDAIAIPLKVVAKGMNGFGKPPAAQMVRTKA
jgi:hypothetical protein